MHAHARGWGDPSTRTYRAEHIVGAQAAGAMLYLRREVVHLFMGFLQEIVHRGYQLNNVRDDWGYANRPIRGYEDEWAETHDFRWLSNHCLAGDTLVQTLDGPVPIRELAGTTPRLLTREPFNVESQRGRWVPAPVRSFGTQPTFTVRLSLMGQAKEIRSTASHRWFVHRGKRGGQNVYEVVTTDLAIGDRLTTVLPFRPGKLGVSPFGIVHGLVYGDGSRSRRPTDGSFIRLWGKDRDLLRYFPADLPMTPVETDGGVQGIEVRRLPRLYRDPPSLAEASSYLAGWLAGYIAADGHVRGREVRLACAHREPLDFAALVASRLGIATRAPTHQKRSGGFAGSGEGSWQLAFIPSTVPDWLLLHDIHLEKFASARAKAGRTPSWAVVDVEPAGEEEVFCATVPGTGAFALDGWILTGNSWGLALDLDATDHPLNTRKDFPDWVVDVARKWGLSWGGDYIKRPDPMHFEFNGTPHDVAKYPLYTEVDDMFTDDDRAELATIKAELAIVKRDLSVVRGAVKGVNSTGGKSALWLKLEQGFGAVIDAVKKDV